MSGEADSGTCPGGDIIDPNKIEEPELDERPACNTNYDSAEGAMPILRCHRCDAFETVSRAALTSHSAQCTAGSTEGEAEGGSPAQEHSRHHRKMFECDVCNMKFSNGANMRRHKMRHTGVKPYECRVCQKRFFRKDHLAEHFSTHSKTLPFHCPICSRGFQRQIAMRAHFQNEHVGQHDLVKACPLCSYRAPTMKALRVHFFNRHGIDLDNPGPGGSGLLGLPLSTTVTPGIPGGAQSDSGDSTGNRSTDNATPPMHFLTPHVEISMADTEFNTNCDPRPTISSVLELPGRLNGEPVSPQSADSNSNAPTSSLSMVPHRGPTPSDNITPSISLIPIKQEPPSEDYEKRNTTLNESEGTSSREAAPGGSTATSTSLSSLIKVSPLKSLLREDLKRRISARVQCRTNRLQNQNSLTQTHEALPSEVSPVATTTNGTITSTGQDSEQSSWRRRSNGLMCLFCGIGFPDQTLYFLHKGCHSDSNPWKCNICGEQCNNVYEFNSHLLSKSHQ